MDSIDFDATLKMSSTEQKKGDWNEKVYTSVWRGDNLLLNKGFER